MPELGKATVVVELNTKDFNKSLKKAEKDFDKATDNMDKESRKLARSLAPVSAEVKKLGSQFKLTFRDSVKAMKLAESGYGKHGSALARLNPAVKRLGLEHSVLTKRTVAMRSGLKFATVAMVGMLGVTVGLGKALSGLSKTGLGALAGTLKKAGGQITDFIGGMGKMAVAVTLAVVALGPLAILITGLIGSLGAAAGAIGAVGIAFGAVLVPIVVTAIAAISKFRAESEKAGTEAFKLRQAAKGFGAEIRKAFGPAANALLSGVRQGVVALRGTFTKLSKPIHEVGRAMGLAFANFAKFLAGEQMTNFFGIFARAGARIIPILNSTFQSLLVILGNIAQAALPVLERGLKGIAKWFGELADKTSNIGNTRDVIETMVDHFRSWWNLVKSIGGAIVAVFSASEEGSRGFVDSLTNTLNTFTRWAKTIEGKKSIRKTFDDTADAIRTLGTALISVTTMGTGLFNFLSDVAGAGRLARAALIGVGTALAALILGVSAPVAAIVGLGAAVIAVYFKFETFRHGVNVAMLSIAQGVGTSVDLIIGAFTQLLGAISSTLSGLSKIPGMGWAKDAANSIDAARDKMDGFRESIRTTVDKLAKQEATRHLKAIAKQVDELGRSGKDSTKKMGELRLLIEKLPAGPEKTAWLTAFAQKAAGAKRPLEELAAAAEKAARTEKISRLVNKVDELRQKGENVGPAFAKARDAINKLPEKDRSAWIRRLNSEAGRATGLLTDIGRAIAGLTSKTVDITINRRERTIRESTSKSSGQYKGGILSPIRGFAQGGVTSGGFVGQPQFMVGEEAPAHPEWVIATNPAYRRNNIQYWMQAGKALGMPGFAEGGSPTGLPAGMSNITATRGKMPKYKKSGAPKSLPMRKKRLAQDIPEAPAAGRFDKLFSSLSEWQARFSTLEQINARSVENYTEDVEYTEFDPKHPDNPKKARKGTKTVRYEPGIQQRLTEIEAEKKFFNDHVKSIVQKMRQEAATAQQEMTAALRIMDQMIATIIEEVRKEEAEQKADAKRLAKTNDAKARKKISARISASKSRVSDLTKKRGKAEARRKELLTKRKEVYSSQTDFTAPNSIPAAEFDAEQKLHELATEEAGIRGTAPPTPPSLFEGSEDDTSGPGPGSPGSESDLVDQAETIRLLRRELDIGRLQLPVFREWVGSYAVGTTSVPRDGIAQVHQGEAIIPSDLNPFIHGLGGGGTTVEVNVSGSLAALDPHIEAVVDGKKAEITRNVNASIGRTVRQSLQVPGGRKL